MISIISDSMDPSNRFQKRCRINTIQLVQGYVGKVVVSYTLGNSPVAYISMRIISHDQTFSSRSKLSGFLSSVVFHPTEVRLPGSTHSFVLTTTFL
jgi:hypothetical protein